MNFSHVSNRVIRVQNSKTRVNIFANDNQYITNSNSKYLKQPIHKEE